MKMDEFSLIIWEYRKKINDNVNETFSFVKENYGLTMIQLRILMEVYHNGSHTIGSIADSISMAGANISTTCKKLEKENYIIRNRDQNDERVVRIELTELGKGTILEICNKLKEKMDEAMEDETEETFEIIISGIKKLNALLEKISKK